ncbi:MAG: hypothetical protein NXH95_17080 [Pseudomonadaceae bacterium]|nr:hypothetical protein [Pseudomonadaceae bacterium]
MDDSRTQHADSVFTDKQDGGSQSRLTLPPRERGSDNDENHDEEGFQTFVLGYN